MRDHDGKIDPQRLDVLNQRKPRKRSVEPMTAELRAWTDKAVNRLRKQPPSPGILIDGGQYASPHDNVEAWEVQIAAAFGTRSVSAMRIFMEQLAGLCASEWDETANWQPNETELTAILAIINGTQPRNEIQAMQAAQICAVHLMQMKLSNQALQGGHQDPRTALIAGKLAQVFVEQVEGLARAQGKRRTSTRQTITVRREVHNHHHQHVHLEGGGQFSEGQAHEKNGTAGGSKGGSTLPCDEPRGKVVRIASR